MDIDFLKQRQKVLIAERDLKQLEISRISEQIYNLQFRQAAWVEVELWIKQHGHPDNIDKNPVINNGYGTKIQHCSLNEKGELVIGGFYHNDNHPRGQSLMVCFEPYEKFWSK